MTYNFDPEKWQDDQLFLLRSRLAKKEISQADYDAAVLVLEEKLDEMWHRLDGTYQVGSRTGNREESQEDDPCG